MSTPNSLLTLVNGERVDQVAATDRGFLYGQTVFETIAVSNGGLHLAEQHLQRLTLSCKALNIPYPAQLRSDIQEIFALIGSAITGSIGETTTARNNSYVLRIALSMGSGGRGYQNPLVANVSRVLSLHDFPNHPEAYQRYGIECGIANIRLAQQPALAGLKHGNRLEQIMARSEWPVNNDGQSQWQESLMLDIEGNVIEGTHSNVFIIKGERLATPTLDQAGVAGVMRETILSMSDSLGVKAQIMPLSLSDIEQADAVLFSNSIIGVWPVRRLNNTYYNDFSFADKLIKSLRKNDSIPTF